MLSAPAVRPRFSASSRTPTGAGVFNDGITVITTAAALGLAGTIPFDSRDGGANTGPEQLPVAFGRPEPRSAAGFDGHRRRRHRRHRPALPRDGHGHGRRPRVPVARRTSRPPTPTPFVLVVEGALQDKANGGAWGDTAPASQAVPWCSIGMDGTTNSTGAVGEIDMPEHGRSPSQRVAYCAAVIAIGQCATFGGYPGCKPPITTAVAGFDTGKSQTDALGTYDFLLSLDVGNQTSCRPRQGHQRPRLPDEPLVVRPDGRRVLVDFPQRSRPAGRHRGHARRPQGSRDRSEQRSGNRRRRAASTRLVASRPSTAPRSTARTARATATTSRASSPRKPGDPGCLQKIGCKGPAAKSLCGLHGWNNQQPTQQRPARTTASRHGQPCSQRHDHDRRPLHSCWSPLHGLHREGLSGQLRTLRGALEILERRHK